MAARQEHPLKSLERRFRNWSIDQLRRRARRTGPPPAIPDQPRILLLRHDRLGDAIVSTPVMTLLRERFPAARLDLLLGPRNAAVRSLLPAVDEALILPSHTVRAIALIRRLRKRRYDVVINLLLGDSASGGVLTACCGAHVRIGFDGVLAPIYDHVIAHPASPVHIVRHTALVLAPLGIDPLGPTPGRDAERLHLSHGATSGGSPCPDGGSQRIVLSLSARVPARQWPLDRWKTLAATLRADGHDVAVAAAPEDSEGQQAVCSSSGATPVPIAGSFAGFVEALAGVGLIVTPQTSTVHVASALGVPTVLLNTNSVPEAQWTPWGVPSRVLSVGPDVASIPVESVLVAVRSLLDELTRVSTSDPST